MFLNIGHSNSILEFMVARTAAIFAYGPILALVHFLHFTYYSEGLTLDNPFSRNTYPFPFISGAFESLHLDLSMYD